MRELGADVSRETSDQLEALVNTLGRWQKAINLVGRATVEDVWIRHVLDSAQLAALIPRRPRPWLTWVAAADSQAWSWPPCVLISM